MNGLISTGWGLTLAASVFGAAVALAVWSLVGASTTLLSPVRRRLDSLRDSPAETESRWAALAKRLGARIEPHAEHKRSGLASRLEQAGLRSRDAIAGLYAAKLIMGIAVPAAAFVFAASLAKGVDGVVLGLLLLVLAVVGWWLPNAYIDGRIDRRRRALMAGFPDALDLLVACTEGGLGLNAALERVAEQLPASHPLLAQELALVNAEIRAGVDRLDALRNLATRTGLDEIRGLVSLITHSARFGTGIAGTLRLYAEEFRDRRLQRAEEQAAMVGTKLIFPLVVCLWPSFFIVAVGPAVINVLRALSGVEFPHR